MKSKILTTELRQKSNPNRRKEESNGDVSHSPILELYERIRRGTRQDTAIDCVNQTIVMHTCIYGIIGTLAKGYEEPDYRLAMKRLIGSLAEDWTMEQIETCRKVALECYCEATAVAEHIAQEDGQAHAKEFAESIDPAWFDDDQEESSYDNDVESQRMREQEEDDACRRWIDQRRERLERLATKRGTVFCHMQEIAARANTVCEWLSDEYVDRESAAEWSISGPVPHYREFGELPYFVEKSSDGQYFFRQQGGDTLLPF